MELDPIEGIYKSLDAKHKSKASSQESTKIVCPNCSHTASAKDINIQDKIAKCGSCHEVFTFQFALQSLLDTQKKVHSKPILGRQKDIEVLEYKGELNISVINFTDWWALVAMSVGSLGGLISMIKYFEKGVNTIPFMISCFLMLLFAVYRYIGYKNNKRYIDVDDQYLYIRNRPKQFIKDKTYLISNIRQFYPKIYGHDGSGGSAGYYHLWMIYDGPEGEEHIKVTPYLRSRSRALYLEQELETFLGIPDERVPEETSHKSQG